MAIVPEGRVFRPVSEKMNLLIENLMQVRFREGSISAASWTRYVEYLLNKDAAEIATRAKARLGK